MNFGVDSGGFTSQNIKKINNNSVISYKSNSDNKNNTKEIKYASFLFDQGYETPYMPCGLILQFQFESNYYKGETSEKVEYKNILGVDKIEIFNEIGDNLLICNKFKFVSNCELVEDNENFNKILLVSNTSSMYNNIDLDISNNSQMNLMHSQISSDNIYYIFKDKVKISYIKIYPLKTNNNKLKISNDTNKNVSVNNNEKYSKNTVKNVKIFCDSLVIFEGCLYLDKPSIILFTCDMKFTRKINEKYLIKGNHNKEEKEEKFEDCIILKIN